MPGGLLARPASVAAIAEASYWYVKTDGGDWRGGEFLGGEPMRVFPVAGVAFFDYQKI